eukprot:TRINITY_DN6068_c0_g1_i1.p2 TRINITY_DN6068_c0_g1~~TRINITY_DN6068_c0_g1_i1.p2  ORF type:complete len:116 (+),score=10.57 TRINITY_DN6068_c0_g1_i1:1003-1350(+)
MYVELSGKVHSQRALKRSNGAPPCVQKLFRGVHSSTCVYLLASCFFLYFFTWCQPVHGAHVVAAVAQRIKSSHWRMHQGIQELLTIHIRAMHTRQTVLTTSLKCRVLVTLARSYM